MTRWLFGTHELDANLFELRRAGRVVADAQPRHLKVLIYLAANAHRVVPKAELMRSVWPGTTVSDATLRSALKEVRAVLGDDQALLRSIRAYGYQLRVEGATATTTESAASPPHDGAGPPRDWAPRERAAQQGMGTERGQTGMARLPVKISAPAFERRMARQRLFGELDAALAKRVIWVMGPAGAGKTTLVRTYAAAKGLPLIWYRVDDGDADVASLFFYLRQTLSAIGGMALRAGQSLPLLTPEYMPGLTTFARRYFETLFAELPQPCLVVFDNCQDVSDDAPWHQVIRQLITSAPPSVHLVMISRAEPHPTLARERAHDEMAIIGWDDLQLTSDEAAELAAFHGSALDVAAISELHAVSGGWAAGLTLMLSQARWSKRGTANLLLEQASQTIFDYFATELFDRLAPEEQRFLLHTAVLPHMTEQLARDLAGFDGAGGALARLYRQNLFLERRDAATAVYEYHPLFRQFLLNRAEVTLGKDILLELRSRAGQALCSQGQIEHGIALLLEAGQYAASVPWLLANAAALVSQGRARTLEGWIAKLPSSLVDANGWLCYWSGICSLGYQPGASVARLSRAFDLFRDGGDRTGMHLTWAGEVRAISLEGMQFAQLDAWIERFDAMTSAEPEPMPRDIEAQVTSALMEALAVRAPGSDRFRECSQRVLSFGARGLPASSAERCATLGSLVHIGALFGSLSDTAAALELLDAALDDDIEPIAKATVRLAQAVHTWAIGSNQTALNIVTRALHESSAAGVHVLDDFFCGVGACITLAAHDLNASHSFVQTLERIAERNRFSAGDYHLFAAWDALARGDVVRALSMVDVAVREADALDYPFGRMSSRFAWSRILTDADRLDEARAHLSEAKRLAIDYRSQIVLRGCLLAEADLAFLGGQNSGGAVLLTEALEVGKRTGIANMVWLPHTVLRRLHGRGLDAGIAPADLQNLVKPLNGVDR